jgi:hypothetical protein
VGVSSVSDRVLTGVLEDDILISVRDDALEMVDWIDSTEVLVNLEQAVKVDWPDDVVVLNESSDATVEWEEVEVFGPSDVSAMGGSGIDISPRAFCTGIWGRVAAGVIYRPKSRVFPTGLSGGRAQ